MAKHPVLKLKSREGRRARAGAPWIFSNEIATNTQTRSLAPGALVNVQGEDGRDFGVGYYNPGSLIAVRLFETPADTPIDRAFVEARLATAMALRETLFDQPFYRLVHAEGDRLPGLVIDRFGETCAVQIATAGMEALLPLVLEALERVVAPANVVVRADAPVRALEGLPSYVRVARGDIEARVRIEENRSVLLADIRGGQKTGWYCDQRENRAFVAGLANGRTLLDVYCHTGGFAVAAAVAGGKDVTGIDSSAPALALAEESAAASGIADRCQFLKADAMEELERLGAEGQRFDIVVCDPPPFVRARKDLESGSRAYRKLARLAARVTAPGGFLLLASCSHNMPADRFRAECAAGLQRAGRTAALIREAGAGPDHPIHPMLPETAYLKALVYRVM